MLELRSRVWWSSPGYQHLAGVEVEKGNKTFPLHIDFLLCCFFPIPAVYVYSVVSEYSTRMSAFSVLAHMALIHRWLFLGALNRLLQPNSVRTLSGVILFPQIFFGTLIRATVSSTLATNASDFSYFDAHWTGCLTVQQLTVHNRHAVPHRLSATHGQGAITEATAQP